MLTLTRSSSFYNIHLHSISIQGGFGMNSYTRIFIKICSLALWSGVFGFIMIVLSSHDAVAGCLPPAGPTETRSPPALTLHSYALDSMLCIHEFEPRVGICEHCKSGVWHQCDKYGRWQPHPGRSCSKEEATPYINGYVQYGQPAEDNKSEHQEPEGPALRESRRPERP